jgi:hypothetical protein
MGRLTLTEYEAEIILSLDGAFAKFNPETARLVEQRMFVEAEPIRSRAFTARTTLIRVIADTAVWIEVVPSQYLGIDLPAGEERLMTVQADAQLVARAAEIVSA